MADKVKREQRDIDRDEELARQEVVRKAVADHEIEAREEAVKRLADPKRADLAEAARLAEIDKFLNESVKRHDVNAARAAKFAKENA